MLWKDQKRIKAAKYEAYLDFIGAHLFMGNYLTKAAKSSFLSGQTTKDLTPLPPLLSGHPNFF